LHILISKVTASVFLTVYKVFFIWYGGRFFNSFRPNIYPILILDTKPIDFLCRIESDPVSIQRTDAIGNLEKLSIGRGKGGSQSGLYSFDLFLGGAGTTYIVSR